LLSRLARFGLVVSALLLTACGFSPLYGETEKSFATEELLEFVEVLPIEDRVGQLVRIELTNRLTPKRPRPKPLYTLQVTLSESKAGLAVQKDSSATRANLTLNGSFKLSQNSDGESLVSGSVRSVNSYDIMLSDFATLEAESGARKRGAIDVADGIVDRLTIFLSRAQDEAPARQGR
jgi:LPS-assembly lipoprotein